MAAVLAPLSVIALWWVSTHGKGTAPGRLVAWGSMLIVVWVLVGFRNPGASLALAAGWLDGLSRAAIGLGHFLGDVLH